MRSPGRWPRLSGEVSAGVQATRPRLLIADDHRMFLESMASRLADEFVVAATAANADELIRLLPQVEVDCILLDLEMPRRNGLDVLPAVRRLAPNARVLVVTMMGDRSLAEAAIAAGAAGFVPKERPISELVLAIHEVLDARIYISPSVPKATHHVSLEAAHMGLHRLTPRQQEIVLMLGAGRTPTDIARELQVSPSTVTFHKNNIQRILGVDECGLTRYAVLIGCGAHQLAARR